MTPSPQDAPVPKGKTSSQKFAEADAKYKDTIDSMTQTERVRIRFSAESSSRTLG